MLLRLLFLVAVACGVLVSITPFVRAHEPARADTDPDPVAPPPAPPQRLVLFWGGEGTAGSVGQSAGFKLVPSGLDGPGFVLMALADAKLDLETVDGASLGAPGRSWPSPRGSASGALLAGAQWTAPWGVAMLLAGPQVLREQVRAADASVVWGETEIGAAALAEIWAHPRPGALATGTLVVSSAAQSLWSRAALGIRLDALPALAAVPALANAHAGPEATLYVDPGYAAQRLGLHLTGLKLGAFEWRIGAGVAFGDETGGYLTFTTHTKM